MRRDIAGPLAGATLTTARPELDYSPVALMPDLKVIKIGGQSLLDRGRAAVFPVLDELVAVKDKHKLPLCCGGGTRARHIYAIASEVEMPTGALAALGGYLARHNPRLLQMSPA